MFPTGFELIVVGAGPAGAITALQARRLGLGPVLLLDSQEFPRQKICAGGLSPRALALLRRLGLLPRVSREACPIHGLKLVGPDGRERLYRGNETAALVLQRRRFDALLLEAALAAGAFFRPRSKVVGLLEQGGRARGVRLADGAEIESRWTVIASGVHDRLGRDRRPRRLLQSCIAWFEGLALQEGVAELFFDRELLPHYGWVFPEGKGRANIGICIERERLAGRGLRQLFGDFLERHLAARLSQATPLSPWQGHPLAVCTRVSHRAVPGTLLVGEAARLVNSATGEGIAYAMHSGQLAAQALALGRRGVPQRAELVSLAYAGALVATLQLPLASAAAFRRFGVPWLNELTQLATWPPLRGTTRAILSRIGRR